MAATAKLFAARPHFLPSQECRPFGFAKRFVINQHMVGRLSGDASVTECAEIKLFALPRLLAEPVSNGCCGEPILAVVAIPIRELCDDALTLQERILDGREIVTVAVPSLRVRRPPLCCGSASRQAMERNIAIDRTAFEQNVTAPRSAGCAGEAKPYTFDPTMIPARTRLYPNVAMERERACKTKHHVRALESLRAQLWLRTSAAEH